MEANRRSRTQLGVGMIEVLITLVVIAIGLLGMAALQARGQLAEMESYQRVQALVLLEDMASRLSNNPPARDQYDISDLDPPYVGTGVAFQTTGRGVRVDADLAAWDALLDGAAETLDENQVGAMIGARGCIVTLAPNRFEISVAWQGLSPTVAPANDCGEDLYGGDDAMRRVVSRTVRFATLSTP